MLFILLLFFLLGDCGRPRSRIKFDIPTLPEPVVKPRFVNEHWNTAYTELAVDLSEPAPPLFVGNEVVDLVDGQHFDSILQDGTDDIRTASLIVFWDSFDAECSQKYNKEIYPQLKSKKKLPPREDLLLALYDMGAAPKRTWYKFLPEHDLAKRFGVKQCPSIVFVPRNCTGWTDWCTQEETDRVTPIGCEDFTEDCSDWVIYEEPSEQIEPGILGSLLGTGKKTWMSWAKDRVKADGTPQRHNKRARDWLMPRQRRTETTFVRNAYMPPSGVRFTEKGFFAVEIPDEIYKMMTDYWEKWEHTKYTESWDAKSNTVMNFHEVQSTMVSLDKDMGFRNKIAIQYLKPLCEKWSGLDLHFESFYGIREYYTGHWLRSHIDRLDTHVISITMNLNPKGSAEHWPLEVVLPDGQYYRYEHPPGYMVFYESTVVIHGRPFKFPDNFHRGAFVHFAPKEWKATVPAQMRSYQAQFTTRTMPDGLERPLVSGKAWKEKRRMATRKGNKRLIGTKDKTLPFEVFFHNFLDANLTVFWDNQRGELHELSKFAPGDIFQQTTYHGHKFVIKDQSGKIVDTIRVDVNTEEYHVGAQQKDDL